MKQKLSLIVLSLFVLGILLAAGCSQKAAPAPVQETPEIAPADEAVTEVTGEVVRENSKAVDPTTSTELKIFKESELFATYYSYVLKADELPKVGPQSVTVFLMIDGAKKAYTLDRIQILGKGSQAQLTLPNGDVYIGGMRASDLDALPSTVDLVGGTIKSLTLTRK